MSKKEQLKQANALLEKWENKWKRANPSDKRRIASYINHLESEVIYNLI